MKPRLIVVGPLPPPIHGVAVSTSLVLGSAAVKESFAVEHLDTSDHRRSRNVGRWDLENIRLGLRALAVLNRLLGGRRGVVYLPLSQNSAAFLRDSLFILLARIRGWKVAAHLRGSDFPTFLASSNPALRAWIRWTLERMNSVAVMGDSLRWVLGGLVPDERLAVVPNGTPEPFDRGVVRDPERVLFLSNLRPRKGVVEAVEAALLVLARRPSARFIFAGAWEGSELERDLRSRTAAVNGSIDFRLPIEGQAKDELLQSAAVLLFPPVEPEGHPRVLLEAMAAGLAIVTTDRGAIRETVGEDAAEFVLDEPEPDALAKCVLRLLAEGSLRERLAASALRRYRARFTQEEADRRLVEWLTRVASDD